MAIAEFEKFLASDELRDLARRRETFLLDVRSSANSQARKARAEGLAEGFAKGRTEGRAEGRAEGCAEGELRATINKVLELIELKFLFLPEALKAKVEGITDIEELNRLYRYGFKEASSLDEMANAIDKAFNRS